MSNMNLSPMQQYEPVVNLSPPNDPADGGLPAGAFLTPQALMAYCENRLGSIDSQADAIFTRQQASNSQLTALNNLTEAINQFPNGFNDSTDLDTLNAAYKTAIAAVGGPSTEIGAKLSADQVTILNKGGDTLVVTSEIQTMVNNAKDYGSELNANAQLDMIQLESLMSDRQQTIQITTNLVQNLGDQGNAIATNIGK
jgi:hypothetical protein